MTQETPERPKTPVVWVVQESVNDDGYARLVGIYQTPAGAEDAARERAAKSRVDDWDEPATETARLALESEYVTITVCQEELRR